MASPLTSKHIKSSLGEHYPEMTITDDCIGNLIHILGYVFNLLTNKSDVEAIVLVRKQFPPCLSKYSLNHILRYRGHIPAIMPSFSITDYLLAEILNRTGKNSIIRTEDEKREKEGIHNEQEFEKYRLIRICQDNVTGLSEDDLRDEFDEIYVKLVINIPVIMNTYDVYLTLTENPEFYALFTSYLIPTFIIQEHDILSHITVNLPYVHPPLSKDNIKELCEFTLPGISYDTGVLKCIYNLLVGCLKIAVLYPSDTETFLNSILILSLNDNNFQKAAQLRIFGLILEGLKGNLAGGNVVTFTNLVNVIKYNTDYLKFIDFIELLDVPI